MSRREKRALVPFLRAPSKAINVIGAANSGAQVLLTPQTPVSSVSQMKSLFGVSPTQAGTSNAGPQLIAIQHQIPVEPYRGLSSITDWLRSYGAIADANNWSEPERIRRLPAYLLGDAMEWFIANQASLSSNSWQAVSESLATAFGACKPDVASFNEMQECRQQTMISGESAEPVSRYFFRKVRLINTTAPKMDVTTKIMLILNGFAPRIRAKLAMKNITTLNDLYNAAKVVEEVLLCHTKHQEDNLRRHEINMIMSQDARRMNSDGRNYAGPSRRDGNAARRNDWRDEQRPDERSQSNPRHVRFDDEETRRPVRPGTPDQRKGRCYYCDKDNHWIKECRKKLSDDKKRAEREKISENERGGQQ